MKINCKINNKTRELTISETDTLDKVLRSIGEISVKKGCDQEFCNACMILFNNEVVPSCVILAVTAKDASIITLDYFVTTSEYNDIAKAFAECNLHFCGFCNAGKVFSAYHIIRKNLRPTKEDIYKYIKNITCSCTELEDFTRAVQLAATLRRNRLGNKKYDKK